MVAEQEGVLGGWPAWQPNCGFPEVGRDRDSGGIKLGLSKK